MIGVIASFAVGQDLCFVATFNMEHNHYLSGVPLTCETTTFAAGRPTMDVASESNRTRRITLPMADS